MADIFSVVADATRRDILQLLRETPGGLTPTALTEAIGMTQPTIMKHVKVLSDAGLVAVADETGEKLVTLDSEPLEEIADWLLPYLDADAVNDAFSDQDGVFAVFSAWSGADAGETIGRTIAERSHRARTVLEDATELVAKRLPHALTRRRGDTS